MKYRLEDSIFSGPLWDSGSGPGWGGLHLRQCENRYRAGVFRTRRVILFICEKQAPTPSDTCRYPRFRHL
jgi:hypothetical protein